MSAITYRVLDANGIDEHLPDLAACLHSCVQGGAAVSFILPFSKEDAQSFWLGAIRSEVFEQSRILFAAFAGDVLVGTVQMIAHLPPNQPHRCEVSKLLVHPDFRGQGVAHGLMVLLEEEARRLKKTLITLDTRTGDKAEKLYG
ncbi:MAG: GNAT family N-acetyltransferase, partial [Hyphomicrobiales bacterium]